jgi:hypothetical protein
VVVVVVVVVVVAVVGTVLVVVVVVNFTEKHDKNLKVDTTTYTHTPRIYAFKHQNVLKHFK